LGGFASEKARALLAYLAVEARQPHRREALAALLWPERAAASARANLSQALYNLRSILGDRASAEAGAAAQSYLLVSSETIQLNPASAHRVDVTAFADLLRACAEHPHHALEECDDCALRLRDAVDLYQGDLLADLAIGDSAPFEEWATVRREQLHRQALDALHHLAVFHEARGEPELGLAYAWRLVELDAWREEGQRLLMRLLARAGQRSAALAQYLACRRQLSEELGVEPAPETTSLYEQIRQGLVSAIPPPPLPPPQHGEPVSIPDRPPFVAREQELAHLGQWLTQALRGEGRVGFVVGEPGSGKTLLVHEFARQAMAVHPDLIVAYGNCNAYTGVGDPYLPFLEILGLLTGDFDGRLASGALTREHSHRLQGLLPAAAQALVNVGPNLINLFVPGEGLLVRAQALGVTDTPWQARLDELAHRQLAPAMLSQTTLFEEYVRVLHALAPLHPLLLIVDDLQWADAGSANLLFHLGRKLAGHRILVLGAYRAEEVALGREGRQHPLEPVVNEFQRTWGDTRLDLAQADAEGLVAQLIAREPNRLGAGFREALYRHTGGHALFTAELLRGMRERGNLQRDPAGCWVEGPSLDWEMLPARVEAVIAQHMARLPQEDRALLEAASVEGEEFTAEVVARVRGMAEGEVIQRLSGSLSKQHRLVMPISLQRLGEQCLSRYRFRHILFQRYLYQHLDEVERMHLHGEVGNALEERYNAISDMPPGAPRSLSDLGNLYGARVAEVSPILPQLARQFGAAGVARKAVAYYTQAMLRAVNALATLEAITLAAYPWGAPRLARPGARRAVVPDGAGQDARDERRPCQPRALRGLCAGARSSRAGRQCRDVDHFHSHSSG
jgi:DNA-binding SARP family transcriptional activator